MNIDLFLTGQSEAGIVCQGGFAQPVGGIIFDAQTHELTLEFPDGSTVHLNIPVEAVHREKLLFAHRMYVGYLEDGFLMDSFEVPLLYLNDPYGSQFGDKSPLAQSKRSVMAFEQFMRRCSFAQGLHRDNLGDEDAARSVLRGIDPHALKYSPTLERQIRLGATPKVVEAPQMPGLGSTATKAHPAKASKDEDDSSQA